MTSADGAPALDADEAHAHCGVPRSSGEPELFIRLDGELWWSHLYRGATEELLTAEADRKRDEFTTKGWTATA